MSDEIRTWTNPPSVPADYEATIATLTEALLALLYYFPRTTAPHSPILKDTEAAYSVLTDLSAAAKAHQERDERWEKILLEIAGGEGTYWSDEARAMARAALTGEDADG